MKSTRGRKPDNLLTKLAIKEQGPDGKPFWRCIAPKCTHKAKGNIQASRVLKHSMTCIALREHDSIVYDEANEAGVKGSLSSQISNSEAPPQALAAATAGHTSTTATSVTRTHPVFTPSSDSLLSTAGTLNPVPFRTAGAKAKAEANKNFQIEVDRIIMRLICVRGLVPNLLDSPEWKELMHKLSGIYKPSSSDSFRNNFIPKEAAFVRNRQIDLLKKEENLTLTFDGTTIRAQESFYTAHATTPSRATYFLDGHQGTGERHDTDWIMDKLLKVSIRTRLI